MSKKVSSVVSSEDRTPTRVEPVAYVKKGDSVARGYVQLWSEDKRVGGFMRASLVLWILNHETMIREACETAIADADAQNAPAPVKSSPVASAPAQSVAPLDVSALAGLLASGQIDQATLLQLLAAASAPAPVAAPVASKPVKASTPEGSPLSAVAAKVKANAKR